jgi:hypothetical protein
VGDAGRVQQREWALVIWSVAAFIVMVSWGETRRLIGSIAGALAHGKILALLIAFAAYVSGMVLLASTAGIWRPDLAGTTSLWFVASGVALLLKSTRVSEETGFLRRTFLGAVGVAALLEAFGSLYVFSLPVELLLVPFVVVVGAVAAFADLNDDVAPAGQPARAMLALLGLAFLVYVSIHVASDWSGPHLSRDSRELVLPVWLTVGSCRSSTWAGF